MIKIDTIADGQLSIVIDGKVQREDITAAIDELNAALTEYGDLNVLVDLTGFEGMTIEAFIADARYGFSHLSELKHYKRIAVVTDADWIEALVWIENKVFRQSEIRCFEPEDMNTAKAFIAGDDVPAKEYEPSIVRIPADRPDLLAFEIRDRVRTADAKAIFGFMSAAYEEHGKIDLMVTIRDFEGFDAGMLFDAQTWKAKSMSLSHIRKYAVVGGPSYLVSTAQFIGGFLPVDIKAFTSDELDEAWNWIGARPALI